MIFYISIFEIFFILEGNIVMKQGPLMKNTFRLGTDISDEAAAVNCTNEQVSYPLNLSRKSGIKNIEKSTGHAKNNSQGKFVVPSLSIGQISKKTNEKIQPQTRIVGGYDIDITSSPSTVAIYQDQNYTCVGNLLTQQHVLTAAHCVTTSNRNPDGSYNWQAVQPALISILAGETHLKFSYEDAYYAWEIDIHPDYLSHNPISNYRDVAVITLMGNVIFTSNVAKASIHPYVPDDIFNSTMVGTKCLLAGWGSSHYGEKGGEHDLKQIDIPLISMQQCKDSFENITDDTLDPTVQVCAFAEGMDACRGDGGSGLFCGGSILAVTCMGQGCASGYPGIYARVDNCADFIQSVLNNPSKRASSTVLSSYLPLLLVLHYNFEFYSLIKPV